MTHSTSQLYQVNDDRFSNLIHSNARLESLWTGGRWTEGPVYFAAGRYLLWSDIPNDRVMRWDETDGSVSVFEQPCRHQNGHTTDPQGRLISCEHGGRAVSRIEHDGRRSVLADRFNGRKLNSPNDVVVKSDGSIWFSDPTYGIDSDYEGHAAPSEIGASQVYRIAPDGTVSAVVTDLVQPNGLAFSPDESVLYITDTGANQAPGTYFVGLPHHVLAYDVHDGRHLRNQRLFTVVTPGVPDGIKLDVEGRVYTSSATGVQVFTPEGDLIGEIMAPGVANFTFGGPDNDILFILADTRIWQVRMGVAGVRTA